MLWTRRCVTLWTAAGLALLAGCTGEDPVGAPPRQPAPTAVTTPSPEPPPPAPPTYVDPALAQRLWRPVGELPRLRTVLPERVDPAAIARAPYLHEAPIERAVLVTGTDPAPYYVSGVAVLSPEGEWRRVDREQAGLRRADHVEQPYELSPDGRTLALGDRRAVVLLDLATAESVRVPVEADDVVLHAWSPDSGQLVLTARSGRSRTFVLDVASRTVTEAEYDAWVSSLGADGSVVELTSEGSALTTRPGGDQVPLQVRLPDRVRVGWEHETVVALLQPRPTPGVLAVDPATGTVRGLLALTSRQWAWASPHGEVDGWVLIGVGDGPGGGVVAWDPVGKRLRGVIEYVEQATHVDLATDLLR